MSSTSCRRELLPLCSIPPRMMRDGFAGANAHIFLPFFGRWYASGEVHSNSGGTIPQNRSRFIGGITKPDTFSK